MIGGACHLIIHTSNISEFIDYTDLFTHARTQHTWREFERERNRYIGGVTRTLRHFCVFIKHIKNHKCLMSINCFIASKNFPLLLSLSLLSPSTTLLSSSSCFRLILGPKAERNFLCLSIFSLS